MTATFHVTVEWVIDALVVSLPLYPTSMQRLKNALPGMPSMPNFGSSGATYSHTEPPIDSDRTELISARRTALDGMLAALTSHHKTLSKVRMDPIGSGDKTNQLPVLWVGEIMGGASQELDRVRNADAATQDYGESTSLW